MLEGDLALPQHHHVDGLTAQPVRGLLHVRATGDDDDARALTPDFAGEMAEFGGVPCVDAEPRHRGELRVWGRLRE